MAKSKNNNNKINMANLRQFVIVNVAQPNNWHMLHCRLGARDTIPFFLSALQMAIFRHCAIKTRVRPVPFGYLPLFGHCFKSHGHLLANNFFSRLFSLCSVVFNCKIRSFDWINLKAKLEIRRIIIVVRVTIVNRLQLPDVICLLFSRTLSSTEYVWFPFRVLWQN